MSNTSEKSKWEKVWGYVKELETKGKAGNSGIETLKSAAVTLGGIYLGSWMGRPSVLTGLAATAIGYYTDVPKLTQFGVSMMTTGGFLLKEKGFKGLEAGGEESTKEKMKNVTESLKYSLYLDKIFPKKKEEKGTNGFGEVQYFKYPGGELNQGGIEHIEDQITQSGEKFAGRNLRGGDDFSGIEERLY